MIKCFVLESPRQDQDAKAQHILTQLLFWKSHTIKPSIDLCGWLNSRVFNYKAEHCYKVGCDKVGKTRGFLKQHIRRASTTDAHTHTHPCVRHTLVFDLVTAFVLPGANILIFPFLFLSFFLSHHVPSLAFISCWSKRKKKKERIKPQATVSIPSSSLPLVLLSASLYVYLQAFWGYAELHAVHS